MTPFMHGSRCLILSLADQEHAVASAHKRFPLSLSSYLDPFSKNLCCLVNGGNLANGYENAVTSPVSTEDICITEERHVFLRLSRLTLQYLI